MNVKLLLMRYELRCEQDNWWPHFERHRDECIRFLENFGWLRQNLIRRNITPKSPVLQRNRWLENGIPRVIKAIQAFTYEDYQHTYAPTNEPSDPRAHGRKYHLLKEMQETFHTYMPENWSQMATCRALASIMNQMKITNAKKNEWSPGSIKRFLARGPDPRLGVTITIRSPNLVPWYVRPE